MGKTSKRRKKQSLPTSTASRKIQKAKKLHQAQSDGLKLLQEVQNGIEALRDGSRPITTVLKELDVVAKAQSILLNESQNTAGALNPTPGLNTALKSIAVEQRRKQAAENGTQRASRESSTVKHAREIVASDKENAPPMKRTKKFRTAKATKPEEWKPPFTLALPSNGTQYSPREVVKLLTNKTLRERKNAGATKRYLIKKNLVPVKTEGALRKVVRKANGDPVYARGDISYLR